MADDFIPDSAVPAGTSPGEFVPDEVTPQAQPAPVNGVVPWTGGGPTAVVRDPQTGLGYALPANQVPGASQPVDPRGFVDRMTDAYDQAANLGFNGWLGKNMAYYSGAFQNPGESNQSYWARLNQAQADRAQHYTGLDEQDPASGWGHVANFLGGASGGVNPAYLFGGAASSEWAPLAQAAARVGTVGLANAGENLAEQYFNIKDNLQKDYDLGQAAIAGGGASLLHGITGELLPAITPTIKRLGSEILEDETSTGAPGSSGKPPVTPTEPTGPVPVPHQNTLSAADQNDIRLMVSQGATAQDILDKYPSVSPDSAAMYGKGGRYNQWAQTHPIQFAVQRVEPPVTPTADNTHVDPIADTDHTGTYHHVDVRDDSGTVQSAGRAYVDPQTGQYQGTVMGHPLTDTPHIVNESTTAIVQSKLPNATESSEVKPAEPEPTVTPPETAPKPQGNLQTQTTGVWNDATQPTHTFTYTTADGTPVNGSYRVTGNQIHSVDVGDQANPVKIGAGEQMNMFRQIAMQHPEVTGPDGTINGYRQTGANPGRILSMNADALRARIVPESTFTPTEGSAPTPGTLKSSTALSSTEAPISGTPPSEPPASGTTADNLNTATPQITDKYAGSINKDRVSTDPMVRDSYDNWARAQSAIDPESFEATRQGALRYLNRSDADLLRGPDAANDGSFNAGDFASWSHAIRIAADSSIKKVALMGDDASDAVLNQAKDFVDMNTRVANGVGRAMGARRMGVDPDQPFAPRDTSGDPSNDQIREALGKISPDDPEASAKVLGLATSKEPGILDLFKKGYISGLVSNPGAHIKVYGGMGTQFGLDLLSDALASAQGQMSRFSGQDIPRVYGTEIAARLMGTVDGFMNAINKRVPGLLGDTGTDASVSQGYTNLKNQLASSTFMKRPMYNTASAVLSAPLEALHQTSSFLKDMIGTSYLWGEAARFARDAGVSPANPQELWQTMADARANPTASMLARIGSKTDIATFQDRMGPLGALIKGAANGAQRAMVYPTRGPDGNLLPISKWNTIPGVSTFIAPFNQIVDGGVRASMRWGGPMSLLDRYNQGDLAAGGRDAQSAVSRMIVASGITGLALMHALQGTTTGSAPTNGAPANSIRVGDNWYQIKGVGGISDHMIQVANAVQAMRQTKDTDGYTQRLQTAMGAAYKTLLDQGTVRDLTPLLAPFNDKTGDYQMRDYLSSIPQSLVPYNAALREYANSNQPYETDTRAPDLETEAGNKLRALLPSDQTGLPPRLDNFGRPMPSRSGPFRTVAAETDPAVSEVNRLSEGTGRYLVGPAGKTYTDPDTQEKTTFTPDQQRQYQMLSGQYIRGDLANTMRTQDYINSTDEEKRATLRDIVREQRANARDDVLTPPDTFVPDNTFIPDKK